MLDPNAKNFLIDLLSTPSPTGFEWRGQKKWADYTRQYADKVENDAYGTAWATLEGSGKKPRRIMLESHADEIGFMIKQINGEGFLRLDRVGGSDVATARGRRLDILGDKGVVRGIIGNTAIHIRDRENEKVPKVHELYVDVGAKNPKEVAALGLRVGHVAVYADLPEFIGDKYIVGRALDNRLGGFIIAQVMRRLKERKKRVSATVLAVNAVQEEVGGHGAKMVTHRLMPDVAICLDVTHATDTPSIDRAQHGEVKLGDGPSVTHGTCNHPKVVERLLKAADKVKVKIQHESSSRYSGTDTDEIFRVQDGVPSGLISLPLRYMHSVVEMANLKDVEQVIQTLVAFVESVEDKDEFGIKL
ncbi:M20/M25/M40 family metallo-hydrolase [Roseimicrobium sp. ORNL1]|uniref:M20/M25/M40 family metallo-hydrolase n=1 Tax=Roseimicrobium sp. ORNL1 TaxID=2711231 RepID=UPI0013E2056E|nr:M20/M25/M40 family metallo-hydrolase [Roseimicrobium sp. ORNL1]QIF00113.1 M42 family metallopeptidase [Roseimicrobium sp. ORNL1]